MADPNLFAVLTACDKSNLASDAFELSENAHCYRKAAEGIAKELMIDSRESTPAPRPLPVVNHEAGYCVLLRLDDPLKDPQIGWQFGTNPRISDVLLGHRGTFGISSRQFYITITDQFRVELHDESRYGTIISHDSQAKDVALKDDKRLLSFQPGAHEQFKEIIVYVPDHEGLAFRIEFPNHREGGLNTGGTYGYFFENLKQHSPLLAALVWIAIHLPHLIVVNLGLLEDCPSSTTAGRSDEANLD